MCHCDWFVYPCYPCSQLDEAADTPTMRARLTTMSSPMRTTFPTANASSHVPPSPQKVGTAGCHRRGGREGGGGKDLEGVEEEGRRGIEGEGTDEKGGKQMEREG